VRILISGAGIAGPTLAHWLCRYGFTPTIVERAPGLRTGGYVIDFWGTGYDIAERMGLIPELEANGYHMRELRLVNGDGRRVGGFELSVLNTLTDGRFMSLPRAELAAAVFRTLPSSVETILDDEIVAIEDRETETRVHFHSGGQRSFDLVIGADGLHSRVRSLVFGPQSDYEVYLGYKVAAAQLAGYRPRDEDAYVLYSPVGRQLGRFALHGDRTLVLFVWEDRDPALPADAPGQHTVLAERFGNKGWECDAIIDALEASRDVYFDRVSQIRMPAWTKGRVALIGDAAFCVSLLGGQGSALAMTAAYVLAGELKLAGGDHRAAFAAYERRLGTFLAGKQKAAARFSGSFVPHSKLSAFIRNQATKLMGIPFVTRLAFRTMVDKVDLPAYPPGAS